MIIIEEKQANNPVRQKHLQQHADEQVKYDKMINLLDSINKKLFSFKDMLTHSFKLEECEKAMQVASNKDLSIKVQVYN